MMLYNVLVILIKLVDIYSGALVIYALLSWLPGGYESSFGRFLGKICEPYLQWFDRLNLNFGGISFSIMIAILVLNMGTRVLGQILLNFF